MIAVRAGTEADLPAVYALNRLLLPEAWSEKSMLAALRSGHELIVADEDGRPAAEHVEQPAELIEHRAAGAPDVRDGLVRLGRLGVEQVVGDAGLHVHDRDVVRDHVVQFPRDAQPLLRRVPGRLRLSHLRRPAH